MNRDISMLNLMIKLQNSGLTLSGYKVVEDLAVLKSVKFVKLLTRITQN